MNERGREFFGIRVLLLLLFCIAVCCTTMVSVLLCMYGVRVVQEDSVIHNIIFFSYVLIL